MTEFVFALDATDEQLKERIQSLPQDEVEALKATETGKKKMVMTISYVLYICELCGFLKSLYTWCIFFAAGSDVSTFAEFLERLQAYRDNNTEDNTVLNFFDFFEVHPQHFGLDYAFLLFYFDFYVLIDSWA